MARAIARASGDRPWALTSAGTSPVTTAHAAVTISAIPANPRDTRRPAVMVASPNENEGLDVAGARLSSPSQEECDKAPGAPGERRAVPASDASVAGDAQD